MPSRRVIQSALDNFLGAFCGRSSEFDGYWLFGFLLDSVAPLEINLMGATAVVGEVTPVIAAAIQAQYKFHEQARKAGVLKYIAAARLVIAKQPGFVAGEVNGHPTTLERLGLAAIAVSDRGRTYRSELVIRVGVHDPFREWRSARVD